MAIVIIFLQLDEFKDCVRNHFLPVLRFSSTLENTCFNIVISFNRTSVVWSCLYMKIHMGKSCETIFWFGISEGFLMPILKEVMMVLLARIE